MKNIKLSKETLRLFSDSGLTAKDAEKMGINDVTASELKRIFPKMRFAGNAIGGHGIPYFDLTGKPTGHVRYRLHDNDDSVPKYLQVPGQKSHFYFPPFVNWKTIAADTSIPIYITEGERKAAKACSLGYACLGLGGVWNWLRKEDSEESEHKSQPIKDFQMINWKDRKTIIVFDSDSQFNSDIQHAIKRLRDTLVNMGADPYRKDLPHKAGTNKVGLDDFLKTAKGAKEFEKLPFVPLLLNKSLTATELLKQSFPETRWLIEGLLPHGLTVLAGPPKIGKSLLVLDMILGMSSGGKALQHYSTEPIKCLYLALEDSPARLKSRILMLLKSGHKANDLSSFSYEWERVEDGGLLALKRRLDDDKKIKAVFIDTFIKMRRDVRGRENLYHQDYEAVASLKRIADQNNVGIVVVHHTKKGFTDDFLESVSGSMGLTGAADTIIVLRRGRNDNEGILHVTGRDVTEQAVALTFDKGIWTYKGEASVVQATETQDEILEILKSEGRPLRQKEIADISGRKNGGLTKTIARMVRDGHLSRQGYHYALIEKKPPKFGRQAEEKQEE